MTSATSHFVHHFTVIQSSCLFFPVTGPIYSVGLVNLPGRLWETDLQVPASQPTHCTGPAGEVGCHPFIYLVLPPDSVLFVPISTELPLNFLLKKNIHSYVLKIVYLSENVQLFLSVLFWQVN